MRDGKLLKKTIFTIEAIKSVIIERVNCEFAERECEILEVDKVQPKVVYRATHEEWAISLVKAGLGISIMPHWKGLTGIVYLPVVGLNFHRTIGIRWRQQPSDLVELFCHFATSQNWNSLWDGI